ncbi:MAG: hypothetical protein ACK5QH_17005 [Rubrivivax sp.]|jgi:hypothetical protein
MPCSAPPFRRNAWPTRTLCVLSAGLIGALALPAQAGGVGGGALRHQRCLKDAECVVKVFVGARATTKNSCGVSVPDVVVLGRQVTQLTWAVTLLPGAAKHRFAAQARVRLDDNNDEANEPEVVASSASTPNFIDQPLPADAARDSKRLGANAHQRMKVHSYTVTLERESAPGTWTACDPYDPIIITRGG